MRGSALACAFLIALSGCGGDNQETGATAAGDARPPLHGFDIYAVGSADGNIVQADVYGITLSPLRAHRLTSARRISWLSADRGVVVVAAGDEQIDKLALLGVDGVLAPIPGLGRPAGYAPQVQPDGRIQFQDDGAGDEVLYRYVSFDPNSGKTSVLYRSSKPFQIVAAGPKGTFVEVLRDPEGVDRVALLSPSGRRQAFPIAERIGSPKLGKAFIATGVYGSTAPGAPASSLVLLDLGSEKTEVIDGWAPLTWTPDGTKLLVVRAGEARLPDAELAVLDPKDPKNPQVLGTIPGLTFFQADWVARD
ncbi:hypothetical protein [Sporichthya brevicatena]|uniref:hypothetical protein n=1 Tax=Sporichthya brevicatena TaxID=171442 RepID=UPI0031E18FB8